MALTMSLALGTGRMADLDLARRCASGDEAAFRELHSRHADLVFNLCLRLTGNRDTAADLTQEVFMRIHRHLGKFRGGSSLRTWIYRVTVNHCRGRLSRRRRPEVSLDSRLLEPGGEPAAAEPDPEARAASAQFERRLLAALIDLPIAFREAVVLRDVEGLGYEEIAQVLSIPIGTVRSRIARGRETLRSALEGLR